MARLILEDGGQRRAFRVNPGKLTIGSGEGAILRLSSSDVAEVHAELVVAADGSIVLHPRPGVLPPTVLGRPVKVPTRIPGNGEFRIGAAVFRLEPEGAAAAAPRAAGAAPSAGGEAGTPRVRLSRPMHKIERGLPTPLILGILAGLLVAAFFVGKAWLGGGATKVEYDPTERLRVAQLAYDEGAIDRALLELDRVDLKVAPQFAPAVAELRKRINERNKFVEVDAWNVEGTKHFDSQVMGYWKKYMQGNEVPRERARVFINRCKDFKATWPQHPELEWVDRYMRRYEAVAELDEPPTFKDVSYEIETLTWAKPRNYARAFALLAEYERTAPSEERSKLDELRAKLERERDEHFLDRMLQAKHEYGKGNNSAAFQELVNIVIWMGDDAKSSEAAAQMALFGDLDSQLQSYRKHRPDKWELMTANPDVRALAVEKGVL